MAKAFIADRKICISVIDNARAKFRCESFDNFQKDLNFNRSNLLSSGSTPHRSRTSSGGECLGALMRDLSVCIWKCSSLCTSDPCKRSLFNGDLSSKELERSTQGYDGKAAYIFY